METLSIAIPTRNRARYLEALLASISRERDTLRDKDGIAVYVYDNDSSDDTRAIVESQTLPIQYVLNEVNVGYDLNILQCYERAAGRYVWVIGDDELLPRGALSSVLGALERYEPGLLIARDSGYDTLVPVPERFDDYDAFARFAAERNPYLLVAHTLISANVVRSALFDADVARDRIETHHEYGQMYGIVAGLSKSSDPVIYSARRTIKVRNARATPVDGIWPEALEDDQLEYLQWLRDIFGLDLEPETVLSQYRAAVSARSRRLDRRAAGAYLRLRHIAARLTRRLPP